MDPRDKIIAVGFEPVLCRRLEEKDGAVVHMCDPDLIYVRRLDDELQGREARPWPTKWFPVNEEWLLERYCLWRKA